MERITKTMIARMIERVGKLSSLAISREQAIRMGKKSFLYAEYASIYGGWRLVSVNVEGGGHWGAFGGSGTEPRKSSKEFYSYLQGLVGGLESINN